MPDIVKAGTTLTLTRTFDAPRDLVFQMWTDAKHVKAWWGPAGSVQRGSEDFAIPVQNMEAGWSGSFDRLRDLLAAQ